MTEVAYHPRQPEVLLHHSLLRIGIAAACSGTAGPVEFRCYYSKTVVATVRIGRFLGLDFFTAVITAMDLD